MSALLSSVLLLISAGMASRNLTRRLPLTPVDDPLPPFVAWGTLFVAWSLASALAVALAALLSGHPLVRLPIVATVSVAAALILHLRAPHPSPLVRKQLPIPRPSIPIRTLLLPAIPVAALHAFLAIDALLRPPTSYDGLFYHLPLIVHWLKAGRLSMMPEVFHFCGPGNGEVWTMFAAAGSERLAELAMIPIGLLLAVVVVGLARELGAGPRGALACVLMAWASPMVALQMYGSYVDLFGATFLLGAIYWILRIARTKSDLPAASGLAGLSLGIAFGTKLTLVPWVGAVALMFVLAAYSASSDPAGGRIRRLAAIVWPFAASLPACSFFWYFRNAWETGWFLYPVKIRLLGMEYGAGKVAGDICTDLASRGWIALTYPWIEWKKSGYPYSLDNGLGPIFAACAVTGLIYLASAALFGTRRRRWPRALVLAFTAVGAVLFVKVCFSYPRYAMPLWLILFAATGPAIGLLLHQYPRGTTALLALTITLSVAMTGFWPLKTLAGRIADGRLGRAATYDIPELFDQFPPGTVVLNMGRGTANYPLLGRRWTNEVVETIRATPLGLTRPLQQARLNENHIEVVFARDLDRPEELFAPDVRYDRLAANTYRIVRP